MSPDAVLAELKAHFGEALTAAEVKGAWVDVSLGPARSLALMTRLRDLGFEYPDCCSGVDWRDRFEVVYHLSSLRFPTKAAVRVSVNRDDPVMPAMANLWPGFNWHEREVYDLFGVRFEGHPDLRRILLPEDWVGYPLRKDYQDERLVPYTQLGEGPKEGAKHG
jgi:NADH-quinone oxidoreductase subunit C